MKHVKLFDEFMRDTVNLNKSRIDTLTDRVDAIKKFLRKSDYTPKILEFSEQGSWAHKTIIKPPGNKGFDADLVMFIDEVEDWEPKDYVNNLQKIFESSGIYVDKVQEKQTRCVKVDYAGDFHLDVVPCIKREIDDGMDITYTYHVLDRSKNKEEPTAPKEYTSWFSEKNRITGTNMLRKVTRLHKYQRDIKQTFSVKSILLTTLLGERIGLLDKRLPGEGFVDLPTSLKTLTNRLDDWLQERSDMPTVKNPALDFDDEDFNRHWDQKKYSNFRDTFHKYREWIDDAYEEKNHAESLRKWRKVFGGEFAKEAVKEDATSVGKAFSFMENATDLDLVAAVKRKALNLARFPVLSYAEKPPWRMAGGSKKITVTVKCSMHKCIKGIEIGNLLSETPINKGVALKFRAFQGVGLLPPGHRVMWQVINSGQAARSFNALRGGFEDSEQHGIRWEDTSYTGIHWVKAFVINNRDQCVGKSDRFFVVIE